MQRVLARLSPLMVMTNREHIPSFSSTLIKDKDPSERTWRELLSSVQLTEFNSHLLDTKRVICFGEQHHQSQVLRAQMSVLSAIYRLQSLKQDKKKIVMVLEHFNLEQDNLLARFSAGLLTNDELLEEYAKSREGFNLNHYLPLLVLARELGIPIYGGFPPREWASVVYKESLEALRSSASFHMPDDFPEGRWSQVMSLSAEQVAYLKSMMSGMAPRLPDRQDLPPNGFHNGILPAQTLKDTFFAWSIDRRLQRDPNNIVFAVCGLGHSEFRICASSRLEGCHDDEIMLIASKEWTSTEFSGDCPAYTDTHKLADVIIPYDADQET